MLTIRRHAPLAVVAVLLALAAVGWWQAIDLRTSSAASNAAVVDAKETAEVQAEVSQALTRVLTYDHAEPETTEKAAESLLAGDARTEYDTLFAALQERAPGQKLVLTAQVQVAAVKELVDDRAELLVFLDQSSQRADDDEASVSAAQLAVEARRIDGAWRITRLKPL